MLAFCAFQVGCVPHKKHFNFLLMKFMIDVTLSTVNNFYKIKWKYLFVCQFVSIFCNIICHLHSPSPLSQMAKNFVPGMNLNHAESNQFTKKQCYLKLSTIWMIHFNKMNWKSIHTINNEERTFFRFQFKHNFNTNKHVFTRFNIFVFKKKMKKKTHNFLTKFTIKTMCVKHLIQLHRTVDLSVIFSLNRCFLVQ